MKLKKLIWGVKVFKFLVFKQVFGLLGKFCVVVKKKFGKLLFWMFEFLIVFVVLCFGICVVVKDVICCCLLLGVGDMIVQDLFVVCEVECYVQFIVSCEVILQLFDCCDGLQIVDEIGVYLGLIELDWVDVLGKCLGVMVCDGQLVQNCCGGFVLVQVINLIIGVVIVNLEGFGFLCLVEGGDDLFLLLYEMCKVMYGDCVFVNVIGIDCCGCCEGSIVCVFECGMICLIGCFSIEFGISYVVFDDKWVQCNVQILLDQIGDVCDGQLVVCELIQVFDIWCLLIGCIIVVFGDKLIVLLIVEIVIYGYELLFEFLQDVLNEVFVVLLVVELLMIGGCVDLCSMLLVIIDGEDVKDFDDVVYCELNVEGFCFVVVIVDVFNYVWLGMLFDDEVQKCVILVYFLGFVVLMLLEIFFNGICLLMFKVDCMCFVCDMQVNCEGEVIYLCFYEVVMNLYVCLIYIQVWQVVGENDVVVCNQIVVVLLQVECLYQLYKVLVKVCMCCGVIEFEFFEVCFVLDNIGEVIQVGMLVCNDVYKLIEECMIVVNVQVVCYLFSKYVLVLFCDYVKLLEVKYDDLLEFLKEFKLSLLLWLKVQLGDYIKLFKKVCECFDVVLLELVLLCSQSLVVYLLDNQGYFGLVLDVYVYFILLICCYFDLLVYCVIKYVFSGGLFDKYMYFVCEMVVLVLQCFECECCVDEVECEVDECYWVVWMEKYVGGQFDGVISGVISFGLFVELDEFKVNGLVYVIQFLYDYYQFDVVCKIFSGECWGKVYCLGDWVCILVLKVSMEECKIDFCLVEEKDDEVLVLLLCGQLVKCWKQVY